MRNEGSEIYDWTDEGSEKSTQEIEGSEKLSHFPENTSGAYFHLEMSAPSYRDENLNPIGNLSILRALIIYI